MNEKSETESRFIDHSKQQILLDFEHDFRNLCAAMQGATDVIRLDTGISNDSFEMLAILDRQLIRLAKVVKGFTDKTGDHDTTAAKHDGVGWNTFKVKRNAFSDLASTQNRVSSASQLPFSKDNQT